MKIVIDIPENIYECVKKTIISDEIFDEIVEAFRNGTPLPKSHDRLIAEPTEEEITETIGGNNDFAECIRDAVKIVFENAETIIEADKAESEE